MKNSTICSSLVATNRYFETYTGITLPATTSGRQFASGSKARRDAKESFMEQRKGGRGRKMCKSFTGNWLLCCDVFEAGDDRHADLSKLFKLINQACEGLYLRGVRAVSDEK